MLDQKDKIKPYEFEPEDIEEPLFHDCHVTKNINFKLIIKKNLTKNDGTKEKAVEKIFKNAVTALSIKQLKINKL